MSLILDALKKSEQERRRDQGPDLQTIHQPPLGRAPSRSYAGLWLALLLLVNGVVLGFWWSQQRSTEPAATVATAPPATTAAKEGGASVPAAADKEATVAGSAGRDSAATAPAQADEFTRYAPAPASTPAPEAAPAGVAAPRLQELSEVPESVRKALPAMTFSFHVYSGDPQKRTIIINNRRLREGDTISDGVLLQEITKDGVILATERHRIHVGVLSGW